MATLAYNTLEEFRDWWLRCPKIRPPMDAVNIYPDVNTVTLYRKGQYQVQMIVCEPNTVIREHSHPNSDSYEVPVFGEADTILEGYAMNTRGLRKPAAVTANRRHSATVGPRGGIFLSIQKWADGVTPKCVGLDSSDSSTGQDWVVRKTL